MHRLLQRQLKQFFGQHPAAIQPFLDAVNTTYEDADAERMAIPESRLYMAFRALKDHEPRKTDRSDAGACQRAWDWLDSHGPNSEKWRRLCLAYFEKCV